MTPEIAKSLGLPKAEGALVADVTAGGPAAKVGIKQGDVILSYEGHDIAKLRDLPLAVAETPVGEKAPVEAVARRARTDASIRRSPRCPPIPSGSPRTATAAAANARWG